MKGLLADTLWPSRLFIFCGRRLAGRLSSFTHLLFQKEQTYISGLGGLASAYTHANTMCWKDMTSKSRQTEAGKALHFEGRSRRLHSTPADRPLGCPTMAGAQEACPAPAAHPWALPKCSYALLTEPPWVQPSPLGTTPTPEPKLLLSSASLPPRQAERRPRPLRSKGATGKG